MEITKDTSLKAILKEYPWLKAVLIKKFPAIKPLFGPAGKPVLQFGTIESLSKLDNKSPEWMVDQLKQIIKKHGE